MLSIYVQEGVILLTSKRLVLVLYWLLTLHLVILVMYFLARSIMSQFYFGTLPSVEGEIVKVSDPFV